MSALDRAAAFEQWSQGGGSPDATWEITRAEAAFFVGTLRGEIIDLRRRADSARRANAVVRLVLGDSYHSAADLKEARDAASRVENALDSILGNAQGSSRAANSQRGTA